MSLATFLAHFYLQCPVAHYFSQCLGQLGDKDEA
jgi:hypothetical protein